MESHVIEYIVVFLNNYCVGFHVLLQVLVLYIEWGRIDLNALRSFKIQTHEMQKELLNVLIEIYRCCGETCFIRGYKRSEGES